MRKFLLIIAIQILSVSNLYALSITSRDKLYLDNALGLKEELVYSPVENIILAPVYIPAKSTINSDDWIRGLYYYSTARFGYADNPFDYIVLSSGKIYKTSAISPENEVQIEGVDGNSIIIGYLSDKEDTDFSEQADSSIRELLLQVANERHLKSDTIEVLGLRFKIDQTNKTSSLESFDAVGTWGQSLEGYKKYVDNNYSPIKKTYSVSKDEVSYTESKLSPGDVAIVEVTLTNNGDNMIFADSDSALFVTKKDGELSKFFLKNIWASQSQVAILSEGEYLAPAETKTFQLKFNVPLYFGLQEETFVIKNALGDTISGTEFRVVFDVGSVDDTVVEILETGTGYLNVRAGDSGNAEVIDKVSPGERYILNQRGEYGYVQIDLGEGQLGWVSQNYIKTVN